MRLTDEPEGTPHRMAGRRGPDVLAGEDLVPAAPDTVSRPRGSAGEVDAIVIEAQQVASGIRRRAQAAAEAELQRARDRGAEIVTRAEARVDALEVELALERTDALHDIEQEIAGLMAQATTEARQLRADAVERATALAGVSRRDLERRRQETERRSVALREAATAHASGIVAKAIRDAEEIRRLAATQTRAREDRHRGDLARAGDTIDRVLEDGDELAQQLAELRSRLDRDGRALQELLRSTGRRLEARLRDADIAVEDADPSVDRHDAPPSRSGPDRTHATTTSKQAPLEPVEYVTATIDLERPARSARTQTTTTIRARRSDLALGPRVARRMASFTRRGRREATSAQPSAPAQRLLPAASPSLTEVKTTTRPDR